MRFTYIIATFLATSLLLGCEDDIFPTLEEAPDQVVIDAWLNNRALDQVITVTRSQSYYDASIPRGITDAVVYLEDDQGNRFNFTGGFDGVYTWTTSPAVRTLGEIGTSYQLYVETSTETYTASARLNRVPAIDSVRFRYEEAFGPIPAGYFAEFFATDPQGPGDTYWIKPYKNGEYLNKPSEISIAYDAGFSAGGNVDGIPFIQPIRDSINPFDQDENDEFLPPYVPGDHVFVELHSISNEAWTFLTEVQIQTDRPGGFGELFATPLSNVPSNILRTNNPDGLPALGFFNVAAITTGEAMLDPNNLPPQN